MVNQSFGRRPNVSRISGFHIKNKDQLIDKLRYLFRMIFCPTKKDWLLFPVHANFSFIHYDIIQGLSNFIDVCNYVKSHRIQV